MIVMSVDCQVSKSISTFLAQYPALKAGDKVAVAVSGGGDSMALAHRVVFANEFQKSEIHIISVDHGLRPCAAKEVEQVANWVSGLARDNVHHATLQWEGKKPETAMLERARVARYDLLTQYCEEKGIAYLFLGHHQDDQAETFLIRLTKGSGLDGLAGMATMASSGNVVLCRPLLGVAKEVLLAYCADHNLPVVHDETNDNTDYMRPRLRQIKTYLEAEGMSAKRLAVTAKRLRRARQALEILTNDMYDQCMCEESSQKVIFDYRRWCHYPEEIGLRLLAKVLDSFRDDGGYPVRMEKLEDLFFALRYEGQSFRPRTLGGAQFSINGGDELVVEKEKEARAV